MFPVLLYLTNYKSDLIKLDINNTIHELSSKLNRLQRIVKVYPFIDSFNIFLLNVGSYCPSAIIELFTKIKVIKAIYFLWVFVEKQDKCASARDIFKSVIVAILVSKSCISLSRVLFYMNLLRGSEDLLWYIRDGGDKRGLICLSVSLS